MSDRLLIGTKKGLFTVQRSGAGRWTSGPPAFPGVPVSMVCRDPRDGGELVVLNHGHFGVKIHRSDDKGANWRELAAPAYPPVPAGEPPIVDMIGRTIPQTLKDVWALVPGGKDQPKRLWCGTIPGGLISLCIIADSRRECWSGMAAMAGRIRRVPGRGSAWRVVAPLDLGAMEAAAAACRGRLDFAAFQSSGSPRRSTVRTMFGLRWEEEGPLLHLDAVADGFLYGMVRCMAGTFVEVGRRARAPETVSTLLASRDRRLAGASAPAHGLCLLAVGYAGDRPPPFVDPALAAPVESGRPRPRDLPEASGDLRTCGS